MIRTDRLILRAWRDEDRAPFAELNADRRVMEYFPHPLARSESDAMVDRLQKGLADNGFTFWAIEEATSGEFIGMAGLWRPTWHAHFTPCVEIGWRLAARHWGKGYASEAARASLKHGFETHGLREIVSLTTRQNARSRRVMERIGMRYDPAGDFLHPNVPEDWPMRWHVLYRRLRS